jgi:hypothetical protein
MIIRTFKHLAQIFIFGVLLVMTPLASGSAQESVAEMVLKGCKKDLVSYCSTVTPGRGRIAACLFAHNDKLSEQCEGMLEVGLVQLSMILSTVSYVVEQCYSDIDEHCEGVVIGGGRLRRCLSKNRDKLEKNCEAVFSQAEKDLQ